MRRSGEPRGEGDEEIRQCVQEGEGREEHAEDAEVGGVVISWVRMVIRRFQGCYDGFGRCFVRVGRRSRLLHRLILRRRRGGEAGSLIDFQLAEIAVDGELGAGFIAVSVGDGVGLLAIEDEGTSRAGGKRSGFRSWFLL